MSVLIPGMEMPMSCAECPLCYDMVWCKLVAGEKGYMWHEGSEFDFSGERLPDCPLVEVPAPHGRLIDADELRQEWLDADNVTYEVNDVLNSIDYAPTIIPAEEV